VTVRGRAREETVQQNGGIDGLFDDLKAGVESPRNRAKKDLPPPTFWIGLEDRMQTSLFGVDFRRYYEDPLYNVECQLRFRLFRMRELDDDTFHGMDLSSTVGTYFECTTLGIGVRHRADGIPIFEDHPLSRQAEVRLVPKVDFSESGVMPHLLEFFEAMKGICAGRAGVVFPTWWRGPLDLAILMRGYEQFISDLAERPEFAHDLLKTIVDRRIAWCEGYAKFTGTRMEPSSIGDDWINAPFISPGIFEEFVLPRYLDLARYHRGITRVHSCGNQAVFQRMILSLPGITGLECSPWTDLEQTVRNTPEGKCIWIELHPTDGITLSNDARTEATLLRIKDLCKGHPFTVGAGPAQTSIEDCAEEIRKTRAFIAVARRILH
jgi:uroporphyrinogen-III decarboxylase